MCRLQKYSLLLEIALMLLYSLLDEAYIALMLTFTHCVTCWRLCLEQKKNCPCACNHPYFLVVNIRNGAVYTDSVIHQVKKK